MTKVMFVDLTPERERDLMREAAANGDVEEFVRLFSSGQEVNVNCEVDWSLLGLRPKTTPLIMAALFGFVAMVRGLLDAGAEADKAEVLCGGIDHSPGRR